MENQEQNTEGELGCCGVLLKFLCLIVIIATFPISICMCIKIVQEYERAIIFRLGRALPGARGPGMFFIIPCLDTLNKIDLRTISFDVPPQEILTKDSVTVAVDAVVYYKISNPFISVCNVENASHSTRLLAQTTLRNILGTKTLSEILTERDSVSAMMQRTNYYSKNIWCLLTQRYISKQIVTW